MRPLYEYGDEVRVVRNLRNDGTFPGRPTGTLLIRRGSTGFVRDIGTFLQDQTIYSVHFLDQNLIVGCREEELQSIEAPWVPSRFETRERVACRVPLGLRGTLLVETGEIGEVLRVRREGPEGVAYEVHFPDRPTLLVPESALTSPAADRVHPEEDA
jgi:nitrogen fixation protein NifZ